MTTNEPQIKAVQALVVFTSHFPEDKHMELYSAGLTELNTHNPEFKRLLSLAQEQGVEPKIGITRSSITAKGNLTEEWNVDFMMSVLALIGKNPEEVGTLLDKQLFLYSNNGSLGGLLRSKSFYWATAFYFELA